VKNQDSNPLQDKGIPKDIELKADRDIFGILPVQEWTCLQLDVFSVLAKSLGRKGLELFYWLCQHKEANATNTSSPKGNIQWEVAGDMLRELGRSRALELAREVSKLTL